MNTDPDRQTGTVLVTVDGGVAVVGLSRPRARNALNLDMCHELADAFTRLDADDDVRVVILHGEGLSFCAGADLKERIGKDAAWVRRRRLASFAAYRTIERCSRPVIAAVHGKVVGSGGEMAMACDFIYAAEGTTFRFPEVQWGTIGATQRLQRVIGPRRAKDLLLTHDTLEVAEAWRSGLVQRVFPAEELLTRTHQAADIIAAAPALAVQLTKQAIDRGGEVTLEQGIAVEMAAIEHNLAGGAWREGIARFTAERRAASSSGTDS